MSDVKWFDRVRKQHDLARSRPDGFLLPAFNIEVLGKDNRLGRIKNYLLNRYFLAFFWVSRRFSPFPSLPAFPKVVCVTRAADVREVFQRPQDFKVPFGPEMIDLIGGANCLLGDDGPEHDFQRRILTETWRDADLTVIRDLSARTAKALIAGSGGTIDVIGDLVTRVVTETCAAYFGFTVDAPDAFAEWTMSVSALLFADPDGKQERRDLAMVGAARIRDGLTRAIEASRANAQGVGAAPSDTLIDRLVRLQTQNKGVPSDNQIRAMLMAMIVGQVPTNTMAGARILEELLRRPDRLTEAKAAARCGERQRLETILFEAARLNPALQPGQWRYAPGDTTIGQGPDRKIIKAGSVLMVAVMSALRDGRLFHRPDQFRLDRAARNEPTDLLFGEGYHACLGARMAKAQLTEIFMVLFAQPNLRAHPGRTGGMAWVGPFPRRLDMDFDVKTGSPIQTMITICGPARSDLTKPQMDALIGAYGNPAVPGSPLAAALASTGIVHFASLSTVTSGIESPALYLVLELNVDGVQDDALRAIAESEAGTIFAGLFRTAMPDDFPAGEDVHPAILRVFHKHLLQPKPWPFGAIGLNFNGTPEFPVSEIEPQARLADFTKDALEFFLTHDSGSTSGASLEALRFVRTLIRKDHRHAAAAKRLENDGRAAEAKQLKDLINRATDFSDVLVQPTHRKPSFPQWTPPGTWTTQKLVENFWSSIGGRNTILFLLSVLLLLTLFNYVVVDAGAIGTWHGEVGGRPAIAPGAGPAPINVAIYTFGRALIALTISIVIEALLLFLANTGARLMLRAHERADVPDDQAPALSDIRASVATENPAGYAQNHFMAVTQLKPGFFRKISLSIALFSIELLVLTRFRKGFVLNMGTIHYAKWVRIPKTDRLVFLANYDGSWESYLEDFVMRAHQGQTAVWSNGVGFPKTENLSEGGAEDGDRFKRWVRRQQNNVPFWYSRYPELTTDHIRTNALIHFGLMRVTNEGAAKRWMSLFGSMQRPEGAIEDMEIQSLVLSGLRRCEYAATLVIQAPDCAPDRQKWLAGLLEGPGRPRHAVCFGDLRSAEATRETAAFVAFSARGLERFGLAGPDGQDGLATFPGAFNMGMRQRGRILGDADSAAWPWSDDTADAVVLLYANSVDGQELIVRSHSDLVRRLGGKIIETINHDMLKNDQGNKYPREHFGFHDGISQPVIRGTEGFGSVQPTRDIVEPGEFLFGYPNNLGFEPPSPTVRAEADRFDLLAPPMGDGKLVAPGAAASPFPDFDAIDPIYGNRDFGRNGTFLVLRQIAQDVDGFNRFTAEKAEEIQNRYRALLGASSEPVTADWVAAKMMGRRRDGTPLVDQASGGKGAHHGGAHNDFTYGEDDPGGLGCPLGAHIRRVNPRDSRQPMDPKEQAITNRHRLLRRGRTYEKTIKPDGPGQASSEKGLLFMAVCGDLERQFEFVQQTWLASPNFHGLVGEPDPIATPGGAQAGSFTIPTARGPIRLRNMQSFVSVKAGGYFFLPSRSALLFLTRLE